MNHCNRALCPSCGEDVSRNYSKMGMPNTQSSYLDNHNFNNGAGAFDEGLGEVIHSRRHREEVMEKKGLHEVSKNDRDLFLQEPTRKPISEEKARDQFEEAEAMVATGAWKEGLSEKRVQEIESGKSRGSDKSENGET